MIFHCTPYVLNCESFRYGVNLSFRHFLRLNNICERLFSRCKLIMTDNRKLMDPSTLEVLIMLRMNKDLWDERDMEWILSNPRFFLYCRRRQRS